MKLKTKVAIVSVLILLLHALIVRVATGHEPIFSGTSGEFWEYLCGVRLRSFTGHHPYGRTGGIYPTTDGWLIYWTQLHHEQLVYRLRPAVPAADLPEVLAKLGLVDAKESDKQVSKECRTWLNENKHDTMSADTLVQELAKIMWATLQRNEGKGQERALAEAEDFRERWARAQRVWLNYLFESLFLTAWVLFAAWPWFRCATPRRWAVHWALWPLLLFVPYFLGYAPYTFTFGPTGGFVYPWVLNMFSLPVTLFSAPLTLIPVHVVDEIILRALPRPLWALTQMTGPAMAVTFLPYPGPVILTAFGLVLGGLVYLRAAKKKRLIRS